MHEAKCYSPWIFHHLSFRYISLEPTTHTRIDVRRTHTYNFWYIHWLKNCRRAKNYTYCTFYYKYEYICIPRCCVTWVIPTTRSSHSSILGDEHIQKCGITFMSITRGAGGSLNMKFRFVLFLHSFRSPITVFGDFFVHSKWKKCVSSHLKLPNYVRRVRFNIYFEVSRTSISTSCSVAIWGVRVHGINILKCIYYDCGWCECV